MSDAALAGVRVVDLGPEGCELAGRILADLGAEVLRVEPPAGAAARRLPPFDAEGRSLWWAAYARGKRSVVIDLGTSGGRDQLERLLASADVLIEALGSVERAALGLAPADVQARHSDLIHVSVSPFGLAAGDVPATDLTLQAAGGLVALQGDPDRPPIPVGFPQADLHAGAQAAADAIVALCEREHSGLGQHLDVSTQAAMVWTLMNATGFPPNHGTNPPGTCEFRGDPPPEILPGLVLPVVLECADGLAFVGFGLPRIGWRTLHRMMRWAESAGAVPDPLRGIDWQNWVGDVLAKKLEQDQVERALQVLLGFVRQRTQLEVQQFAVENEIVLAPIYTVEALRRDPQLAARGYWTKVGGVAHAGPFARLAATPIRYERGAPALGEAQPLLRRPRAGTRARAVRSERGPTRDSVFAGLKVADFAWVGVGPLISKALADHGATVVHVESASRPDVLRLLPPFKDGKPGYDRAQFMANFNSSKLGLALDYATDGGRVLARRLADWADVVVESFTPGTMHKLGLDYASLSSARPELVMLSTCLRGQSGPEARYGGFGNQGAALAGIVSITGWPDRFPCGPWGAYTDFIAPRFGLAALAAALRHRLRTGRGQHIDLSQVEAAIHFIEPLVLEAAATGRVAGPSGLRSAFACPHWVFASAVPRRFVAIGVESPAQWRALHAAVPELARFDAAALEALDARLAQRDLLERALSAWCAARDPFEAAAALRAVGVPGHAVLWPSDLYADPWLEAREFFVKLDHSVMGPTPYDGPVTRFSRTPARLRGPGPCLGEHTQRVLAELLGLDEDEITRYAVEGALS